MARHRNVRNMNYDEEYDFDDTYGRSVEDDYCISPSTAAEFMYDRSTSRHSMSAFLGSKEHSSKDTESEEESSPPVRHERQVQYSPLDEARLQSCLEGIRNVVGDNIPEQTLIDAVVRYNFDMEKALDAVLSNRISPDKPKPQRPKREGRRSDDSSDSEREGVNEIDGGIMAAPSRNCFSLNFSSLPNDCGMARTLPITQKSIINKSLTAVSKPLFNESPTELSSEKSQKQNKEDNDNFSLNINLSSFISVSPKGNRGTVNSVKRDYLPNIENNKHKLKDVPEQLLDLKNNYIVKHNTSSKINSTDRRLSCNVQSSPSNELHCLSNKPLSHCSSSLISSTDSSPTSLTLPTLRNLLTSKHSNTSTVSSTNVPSSLSHNAFADSVNSLPLSVLARQHLESKAPTLSLPKSGSHTQTSSSLASEKPFGSPRKDTLNLFSGQISGSDLAHPNINITSNFSLQSSSPIQTNNNSFCKQIIPQSSSNSNNLLSQLAQNHLKTNQFKSTLKKDGFNKIPSLLITSKNEPEQKNPPLLNDEVIFSFDSTVGLISVNSSSPNEDRGSSSSQSEVEEEEELEEELDLLKALKISDKDIQNNVREKLNELKDSQFSEPSSPLLEEFSQSPVSCFNFTKPVDIKENPSFFGLVLCSHLKAHKLKTPSCSRPNTPSMLNQLKIEPFDFATPSPDDIIQAQKKRSRLYKDYFVKSN